MDKINDENDDDDDDEGSHINTLLRILFKLKQLPMNDILINNFTASSPSRS